MIRVTKYNVIMLTTLIILISLLLFAKTALDRQQKSVNRDFNDSIVDSSKCPKTAKFFAKWQSTYNTWHFGLIGGVIIGFFTMVFMYLLNWCCDKDNDEKMNIPIITAIVTVVSTMVVYKLMNCFIGRVCGQDFCGKNLDSGSS